MQERQGQGRDIIYVTVGKNDVAIVTYFWYSWQSFLTAGCRIGLGFVRDYVARERGVVLFQPTYLAPVEMRV